jgi:hypothetical protein
MIASTYRTAKFAAVLLAADPAAHRWAVGPRAASRTGAERHDHRARNQREQERRPHGRRCPPGEEDSMDNLGFDLAYRVFVTDVQHQIAQDVAVQRADAAPATPPLRARLAQALVALAARLDPATGPAPSPAGRHSDSGSWLTASGSCGAQPAAD